MILIDVQLLLASGSNQTTGHKPAEAAAQAGAFAQQLARASQDSASGRSGLSGAGFVTPVAAEGAGRGLANAVPSAAARSQVVSLLPASMQDSASGAGGWQAVLQQLADAAELSGQQGPAAAETSPQGAMQALLSSLEEQLPAGKREQLLGLLNDTSSGEAGQTLLSESLFSEWQQLGAEEQTDLIANLAEGLPDDVSQQVIDALSRDRPVEAAEALFAGWREMGSNGATNEQAGLIGDLAERQHNALLDGAASNLAPERPPQMDEQLLAQVDALLAAQQGGGRSSSDSLRVDLSELRGQLREWLSNETRLNQPLTLNSAQRGALTAEGVQALLDGSSQRQNAESLPAGFRDAILSAIASRDGGAGSGSGQGRSGTDGMNLAGGMLGGQVAATSAAPGTGASAMTAGINAPLTSSAWPQQLGQQLVMLTQRGGEQKVEIRLNPPELGPLTVSLKVFEQSTQIQFLSANAQVRGAVEQAIPQLREALAEQGIQLGETSVGEQHPESNPQSAGHDGQGNREGVGLSGSTDEPLFDEIPAATAIQLDGRVDLYA
jgi:flagellar hook-length control protein FliK